jgi:hypothetical protein
MERRTRACELIFKCIALKMYRLRSFLTSAPKCISSYAFDGHGSLLYRLTTSTIQ